MLMLLRSNLVEKENCPDFLPYRVDTSIIGTQMTRIGRIKLV